MDGSSTIKVGSHLIGASTMDPQVCRLRCNKSKSMPSKSLILAVKRSIVSLEQRFRASSGITLATTGGTALILRWRRSMSSELFISTWLQGNHGVDKD